MEDAIEKLLNKPCIKSVKCSHEKIHEIIRLQHKALKTIKEEGGKTIIHECEKCHEYDYSGAHKGFMAQAEIAEGYLEQVNHIAEEILK